MWNFRKSTCTLGVFPKARTSPLAFPFGVSPRACSVPRSHLSSQVPQGFCPRFFTLGRILDSASHFSGLLLLLRPFPQGFCPKVFAFRRIFYPASHFSAHSFPYSLSPRASALRFSPSGAFSIPPRTQTLFPTTFPLGLSEGVFYLASCRALPRVLPPGLFPYGLSFSLISRLFFGSPLGPLPSGVSSISSRLSLSLRHLPLGSFQDHRFTAGANVVVLAADCRASGRVSCTRMRPARAAPTWSHFRARTAKRLCPPGAPRDVRYGRTARVGQTTVRKTVRTGIDWAP